MESSKTFELLDASGLKPTPPYREYFSDSHLERAVGAAHIKDSIASRLHIKACQEWVDNNPKGHGDGSYFAMAHRFIRMQAFLIAQAYNVDVRKIINGNPGSNDIIDMMNLPAYKGKEHYNEGEGYKS